MGSAGQGGPCAPQLWAVGKVLQGGAGGQGSWVAAAAGQMAAGSCLEAGLWDMILTAVEWVVPKQAPVLRGEVSFYRRVLRGVCQDVRWFKVMILYTT